MMPVRLSSFFQAGNRALDAVSTSFAPPEDATSASIRRNGALCVGIGVLCFALGAAIIAIVPSLPIAAMLPIFAGYAFIVVGAYRAIMGKTPKPEYPDELSMGRIAFAIAAIVLVFGALIGLAALADVLFGGT
jgi:hypothetical protein